MPTTLKFGHLLRRWREHRRLSQLALASEAGISARHLSFLETGRSNPSREIIVRLGEHLQIPLRQRNILLRSAGFADVYAMSELHDPSLKVADSIIQAVLSGHDPNPAMAIDQCWNVLAMNRTMKILLDDIAPHWLGQPLNIMRLSMHPLGLGSRLLNFEEWRAGAISRLKQRIEMTADQNLAGLLREIESYATSKARAPLGHLHRDGIAATINIQTGSGVLNLITTTMVFSSPFSVALSELSIECFFPIDRTSGDVLKLLRANYPE